MQRGMMGGMQHGMMGGMMGGMMHGGMQGGMQRGMKGGMQHGGMQRGMMGGMMQHGGMQRGVMQHGTDGSQQGMMGGEHGINGMQGGSNMADMQQIHTLLANHDAVRRTVRNLPNGVETVTTSQDTRIAAMLPQHVEAMYARLKEGRLIRGFDPLFVELFRQADKIDLKLEKLDTGVRVVETSNDPHAIRLIQAHARAVDGFVKDGMDAMHRKHSVPAAPKHH